MLAVTTQTIDEHDQAVPISERDFGCLPDGESVRAWVLTGTGGLTLECISYGATVTRLLVPDRLGRLDDVVLGFNNLEDYLQGTSYFGGMIGRVAGRIPRAQYRLGGAMYQLTVNDGANQLHGGCRGFDKRQWQRKIVNRSDGAPSLRLELISPDGEEGHPGTVHIALTYTVTHDNSFLIETEAVAHRPTPLSMTHHSYFNLAGESHGTIVDHELQVHSDACIAVNQQMAPMGIMQELATPGNDLRSSKNLGATMPHLFQKHGDLYRLRRSPRENEDIGMYPAARLIHSASGRALDVKTSAHYLQVYTASDLNEARPGKSGSRYGQHAGLCLECEGYPDGVNHPELGDILLRPGEVRREATAYIFSTIDDPEAGPR